MCKHLFSWIMTMLVEYEIREEKHGQVWVLIGEKYLVSFSWFWFRCCSAVSTATTVCVGY